MITSVKFVGLLSCLACLLTSLIFLTPSEAQTVHALLVLMDDDPSIGNSVKVDKTRIQQLLDLVQNETPCEVDTTTLLSSKDNATREEIVRWLNSLSTAANDVVFIYYSGHGGMNDERQTFLATQGKYFYRTDLVNAINSARLPRLTMLITDCCSSLVRSSVQPGLQSSRSVARPAQQILSNLFLEHKGFLHLTSASEGQYAWGSPATGGWFTRGLINAMNSDPDKNRNNFLSWEEVVVKARENTEKTFKQTTFTRQQLADMKRLGITSQTPKAYMTPTPLSGFILNADKLSVVDLLFAAVIVITFGIARRSSRKLREQRAGRTRLSSHRKKVATVVGLELLIWLGLRMSPFLGVSPWLVCLGGLVALIVIFSRKDKRYA